MANRLKMVTVEAILTLLARGRPQRRIARELGVDRETVGRYARLVRQQATAAGPPGARDSAVEPPVVQGPGPSKPANTPIRSAVLVNPECSGPGGIVASSNGGFITLRPPADEGAVTPAAAKADSPGAYPLP